MGLLLRGAQEHDVPADWILRLKSQRTGGLKRLAFVAPVLMAAFEIFFRIQLYARRLIGR